MTESESFIDTVGRPTKLQNSVRDAAWEVFHVGMELEIDEKINKAIEKPVQDLNAKLDAMQTELKAFKHVTLTTNGTTRVLPGLHHKVFPTLLELVNLRKPLMLVGSAGTGKTFAAEQCAEAIFPDRAPEERFYAISVGLQTSMSHLLGFIHANGQYVRSAFREAFEHGGVFLMDEIDAGNPNVLVVLNAALAGNFCAFPDGMVRKHPEFFFIAAANTFGLGANRQYVGRTQLDAATLDRFMPLMWDIDEDMERAMVAHYKFGHRWQEVVSELRQLVEDEGVRLILSPRATEKGSAMLEIGMPFDLVIDVVITPQADPTMAATLKKKAIELWG